MLGRVRALDISRIESASAGRVQGAAKREVEMSAEAAKRSLTALEDARSIVQQIRTRFGGSKGSINVDEARGLKAECNAALAALKDGGLPADAQQEVIEEALK